jgi:hypothetical protein
MQHVDHILESLATRTQRVFDTALGEDRHQLLTRRLYQLYGALELARLLTDSAIARRRITSSAGCQAAALIPLNLGQMLLDLIGEYLLGEVVLLAQGNDPLGEMHGDQSGENPCCTVKPS